MSAIINISNYLSSIASSRSPGLGEASVAESVFRERRDAPADTVELSSAATRRLEGVEESTWRVARQAAIKAEIEDGTYITRERFAGTVERLLDVLA